MSPGGEDGVHSRACAQQSPTPACPQEAPRSWLLCLPVGAGPHGGGFLDISGGMNWDREPGRGLSLTGAWSVGKVAPLRLPPARVGSPPHLCTSFPHRENGFSSVHTELPKVLKASGQEGEPEA